MAEVVVALLILQIGILSTMTLTISALRTLAAAEDIERAILATRTIADSLSGLEVQGPGQQLVGHTLIRWRLDTSGAVEAEAVLRDRVRIRVRLATGWDR